MVRFKNIAGQRFGRLLVLSRAENASDGETRWNCRCDCGTDKVVPRSSMVHSKTKSCGCLQREAVTRLRGELSPNWRGGKFSTENGYVRILEVTKPGEGPSRREFEHRLVMERHLGRRLYANETVHHRNGIRSDNDISNLELRAGRHGPGQTIPDLIMWAKEVLTRYEPQSLVEQSEGTHVIA